MFPTNLQPRPGLIYGEIIEKAEKVLDSGIILTGAAVDQGMDDMRRAKVISSGVDFVQPGDVIIYTRFVGTPVGETVIFLEEKDILAKEV